MKTLLLSPPSVNPKTRISEPEEKDSCYYPRCRKNANCDCEMCLASINATLDLMPMSAQRSTLTKISASRPTVETTPVSIDPTLLSTPVSKPPPSPASLVESTAESGDLKKCEAKKRKLRLLGIVPRWVLLVGMMIVLDFGFSWGVPGVLRPALSEEKMRDVVTDCSSVEDLSEGLNLIQKGLEGFVGDRVSSCNLGDSTWKIDQDGMIMHSYCIMYRSAAEEVIVRGWPLQTAGLLTAGFSSRSFSVLSGRFTEWPEGNMAYVVRDKNSTWILRKWGASVVKFDANTWIVEYKKSMFLDGSSILFDAVKFLNFRITKVAVRMRQHLWLLPDLSNYAAYIPEEDMLANAIL
ncbi:uncharacterized protein LOC141642323 [Silene latifolia]|uniref:uncharacterized protein LOC141642323 n=1 Tax=Silene latifolia TaxID=37657 RepID=UPI003D786BD9